MEQEEPWQRSLREALVVLSLPPDEQVRANGPGCLTCDLLNDFDLARSVAIDSASVTLSAEQRQLLERIDVTMTAMHGLDVIRFDDGAVRRPVWGGLRGLAAEELWAFGWEGTTLQPFVEVEPGVWRRTASDG